MADYIDEVFGPGGLLASRSASYEQRPGQVALARKVDEALRDQRHLLAEAPCGSGKTLAQCVPAIHHAVTGQKKAVVVTANIALQEQLVRKDLPFLRSILPTPFRFAVLKGRSNFACAERLHQIRSRPRDLFGGNAERELDAVLEWAKTTQTGDASDLPFSPSARTWAEVSVTAEACLGATCPKLDSCFAERARAEAMAADLVVTNYHVLGAHLVAKRETGQDCILPSHSFLILDEGHAAADILRECLGFRVTRRDIDAMARAAREALGKPELAAVLDRSRLFDTLAARAISEGGRTAPLRRGDDHLAVETVGALEALSNLATARGEKTEDQARGPWQRLARKTRTLADRIADLTSQQDPNKVYWVEVDDQQRASLCARPIEVASTLRHELFAATESVCVLSATLATDRGFEFIRRELGVPREAMELVVESPFDFRRQGLLIVPEGLPEPSAPDFVDAVAAITQQVIDRCKGRTLGLFTSYRNLNGVYERLDTTRYRVLKQGDLPRPELVRQFQQDVHSVLLGTESLWTGIDVPGESLTAVVIDKIPFPRPDDPVLAALAARDRNAFQNQLLPRAIIALKQGVGRLIRSQADIGVVVILDRRLVDKRYGGTVLRSLPPMLRSRQLSAITDFLPEVGDASPSLSG